jgi:transketolase
MDGHAFDQLVPALEKTSALSKPRALIVHTIKGRGIRAFENDPAWHARKIKGEDLEIGRRELGLT